MERMHPEDLRAKLAMKFVELYARHGMDAPSIENAVHDTDALLSELKRTEKVQARVKELEAENPTLQIKYQYIKDLREKLKLRPEESLTHAVACEHNKLNEAVELLKEIRCELDDLPLDKEGYQRYCKIIRFLKTIPS